MTLIIYKNLFFKSVHKTSPYANIKQNIHTYRNIKQNIHTQTSNKIYIHKHHTHIFEELVPSVLPLIKERGLGTGFRRGGLKVFRSLPSFGVMYERLQTIKEDQERTF